MKSETTRSVSWASLAASGAISKSLTRIVAPALTTGITTLWYSCIYSPAQWTCIFVASHPEELVIFKRGRNSIKHIPKNGDKHSYEVASGLEAIIGYLYLTDENRMNELFKEIFKGVGINE